MIGFTLSVTLCATSCSGTTIVETGQGGAGASNTVIAATGGGGPSLSSGLYVLSVSWGVLPSYPIVFDATLEIEGQELWLRLEPLMAADRTTLLGPSVSAGPFPILDFPTHGLHYVAHIAFTTVQEVLPSPPFQIEPGSVVTFDVHCEAEEPTCGRVSGVMERPKGGFPEDLTGATFALTLASDPDAHLAPIIDCAGTRAAPL